MRTWSLPAIPRRSGVTSHSLLDLFQGIGTENLSQNLLDAVRREVPAAFSSVAVRFPDSSGKHISFGAVSDKTVEGATIEYDKLRVYDRDERWRPPKQGRSDSWMSLLDSRELDPTWRNACYDPWQITERCSIITRFGAMELAVSFFRRSSDGRFEVQDLNALEALAPFLLAAARQHYNLTANLGPPASLAHGLSPACESLSGREKQVVTEMMLGLTCKEIALKLEIGLTSVITYRQRAYQRLGISRKGELLKLCRKQ